MKNLFVALLILFTQLLLSQPSRLRDSDTLQTSILSGLKFRSIGPAIISGRVIALAVNLNDHSQYYVGVASGGVWRTVNNGTTFEPVFDHYGSYSIGSVAINPSNPHEVWVGTGEANSQRSVSYGDGIYKSEDDGHSFKNMGLKNSEHIAAIVFDPRDSKTIYVAASDWIRAMAALDRILILEPRSLEDLLERAKLYETLECFQAALDDLQSFLSIAPDHVAAEAAREGVMRLMREVSKIS